MIRYGFIRTKDEIKFLVLYAMQFLKFPVPFEAVADICTWCDDGFSFFDLQEAFTEMVQSGHIAPVKPQPQNGPQYEITAMGREAAEIFENSLPYSVREAAQASALRVVRKIRREAAISTAVAARGENDFVVSLCLEDVFSIQMNVVSRSQASLLERNFKKNAENIYHVLLDALVQQHEEKEDPH